MFLYSTVSTLKPAAGSRAAVAFVRLPASSALADTLGALIKLLLQHACGLAWPSDPSNGPHRWWEWWSRSRPASACTGWWSYPQHRDRPARRAKERPQRLHRPAFDSRAQCLLAGARALTIRMRISFLEKSYSRGREGTGSLSGGAGGVWGADRRPAKLSGSPARTAW